MIKIKRWAKIMIKQECRNTLNSLNKLIERIRTKDPISDCNIPIYPISPTTPYPSFQSFLFIGHQLLPPTLQATSLDFNRNLGPSRADVRSKTAMRVMTFSSCPHLNRTSKMLGDQTLEANQTPGIHRK